MSDTMSHTRSPLRSDAGFSLIEMMISMTILTVIMGATLGGLSDIMKANQNVLMVSSTNNSLRGGMDLMVRDMLQVGSGLPASHAITIPSGAGSQRVRIPGPPGTTFLTTTADLTLPAVMPRPGVGPTINGVATDVLTVMMADNAFESVTLSAVAATSVVVAAGPVLDTGPDRVLAGQLMMISKGSGTTLVQVTTVDYAARRLTFADGDSLRLNQSAAAAGSLPALNAVAPVNSAAATRISRVRMITYYVDATTNPARPRLVRRVNNGDPLVFDNYTLGTAVAFDTINLQFAFDISNGLGNPGNVEMTAADLAGTGACSPNPCGPTLIRKVNVTATGRSKNRMPPGNKYFENTLSSQVSLRGMAFLDKYRS
jgi:prepilin-type N-terminal cleavage/methylation domain-containing protein